MSQFGCSCYFCISLPELYSQEQGKRKLAVFGVCNNKRFMLPCSQGSVCFCVCVCACMHESVRKHSYKPRIASMNKTQGKNSHASFLCDNDV